jgi:hypothetical protein
LALDPSNELLLGNSKLRDVISAGAQAHIQAEEFEKAIEDAKAAIAKNGEFVRGYLREMIALQELDRVDEALQAIKAAPAKVQEDAAIKAAIVTLQQDYNEDHVLAKGGLGTSD